MSLICENCRKKYEGKHELTAVFPDIPDLLERIEPGETVPAGECPDCGALVHGYEDQETLCCTLCGDAVPINDLREHLRQHNPNVDHMDWVDVRNVFRVAGDSESRDELEPLNCPECGEEGRLAQVDLIPGYAMINGVNKDGSIEWAGETRVDWDMQRPASNPPELICLSCNGRFMSEEVGIK